jgi:cytochrome c peroxidase
MRCLFTVLVLGLSLPAGAAALSAEESAAVLSHGPWPPPARRDATNPVSGKPEAIALGERLFFEPRLSGTGSVLCASCHVPYRRFQDSRARAFGLEETARNTPTLLDVGFYPRWGWEGARDSLWSQSIRPLLEPREMRSSPSHIGKFIRSYAAADYKKTFGRPPPADDAEIIADVGRALAAYQETLVSTRTSFDAFRDAWRRRCRRHPRLFEGPARTARPVRACEAIPGQPSPAAASGRLSVPRSAQRCVHGAIHARQPRGGLAGQSGFSETAPEEIDDVVAF